MKYERLTQWVDDGASLILDNPRNVEEAKEQLQDKFKLACIKLATLEDKIERGELVEGLAKRLLHRVEVLERALIIMAERVLEYAEKAKLMAMTSDGMFSFAKDAQLALLTNDALIKAEQKMTEEEK